MCKPQKLLDVFQVVVVNSPMKRGKTLLIALIDQCWGRVPGVFGEDGERERESGEEQKFL